MVRVGVILSTLVVVAWIILTILWLRSEDLIPPLGVVLVSGGAAFLTLLLVWIGIALAEWIRQIIRAAKGLRSDSNSAKPT